MQISISDDKVNFKPCTVASFDELAKVVTTSKWSPSTYKNEYRNKENFEQIKLIALDFDSGITIEAAKARAVDYQYMIAPTKSHGKEKNGQVCDRFRLVIPLSAAITDAETYQATWQHVFELFPECDTACRDVSRYYDPSISIDVIKKDGLLVTPVKPAPKVEKVAVALSTDQRGTLGVATLRFLHEGAPAGAWNAMLFKAAVDMNQNKYSYEDALEKFKSMVNPVFTGELDAHDMRTIESAFDRVPKHEPRVRQKAFSLVRVGELYKTDRKLEWVVDRLLTVGGVSIISADPKAGKSTIVRQLMREVLRGADFLDRKCKQGSIHYYAIEEQLEVLNASFKRLGVTDADNLLIHVGDPLADTKMEDFEELLKDQRPVLAVIDTMFDFIDVESENNYKEVKRELRKIRKIARDTGTHILLVHHTGKGSQGQNRFGSQKILGSTAIAGGVDTTITISVAGRKRLVNTTGREIRGWSHREIVYDFDMGTYKLGPEQDDF